jgi:hypothetical protein
MQLTLVTLGSLAAFAGLAQSAALEVRSALEPQDAKCYSGPKYMAGTGPLKDCVNHFISSGKDFP